MCLAFSTWKYISLIYRDCYWFFNTCNKSTHSVRVTYYYFFLHYINAGTLFLKPGYTILSSRTRNLIPLPTMKPLDGLSYEIIKLYGQENGLNYHKHALSSCDSRDVLIEGQSWWYLSTVRSSSLRAGPPRGRTDTRAVTRWVLATFEVKDC